MCLTGMMYVLCRLEVSICTRLDVTSFDFSYFNRHAVATSPTDLILFLSAFRCTVLYPTTSSSEDQSHPSF